MNTARALRYSNVIKKNTTTVTNEDIQINNNNKKYTGKCIKTTSGGKPATSALQTNVLSTAPNTVMTNTANLGFM